jgi:hypothetical protein
MRDRKTGTKEGDKTETERLTSLMVPRNGEFKRRCLRKTLEGGVVLGPSRFTCYGAALLATPASWPHCARKPGHQAKRGSCHVTGSRTRKFNASRVKSNHWTRYWTSSTVLILAVLLGLPSIVFQEASTLKFCMRSFPPSPALLQTEPISGSGTPMSYQNQLTGTNREHCFWRCAARHSLRAPVYGQFFSLEALPLDLSLLLPSF